MIYIFLANGFEEVEAIVPFDYLKRCFLHYAGCDVKTISINKDKNVFGSHGLKVSAESMLDDVDIEKLSEKDMVILPGGLEGVKNLSANDKVKKVVKHAAKYSSVGAICAAPSILGSLKLLDGVRACCYPGFEEYLSNAKVSHDEDVVIYKNIITAKGAGVADKFAFSIVKYLYGEDVLEKLKKEIQWQI